MTNNLFGNLKRAPLNADEWSRLPARVIHHEVHPRLTNPAYLVRMRNWNALDWIAVAFVIVGGINWGLVGAFGFNLVETIFGPSLSAVMYVLVGLSALYMIFSSVKVARTLNARHA